MKKIVLLIAFMMLYSVSFGQKLYKKDLLALEKSIYKEALNNYDLETAQTAVYHIIKLEGEQSKYMDTLAFIYFNQKKYLPALRVADKILKKQEKLPILEIKAVALENLQALKDAIDTYDKIYKLKKDVITAYKLAELQEQLKRSAEAYATLKSAENLKFPEKGYVTFPGMKKNTVQKVPLKAAFYDLIAKTSYDLHNYDMAIKYYDEALKIYPDFYLAKQNKQAIVLMKEKLNSKKPNDKK